MATENKPEGRSSNIKEKLYSHRKLLAVVLIGVVGASVGLGIAWPYMFPNLPGAVPHLRMATTTSVDNSGLLAYLVPDFESRFKCKVDWIPQGSGAALTTGRNGDADLLLVHDKPNELTFVNDGHGYKRACFMWNDFVLVGPTTDPVGVNTTANNNVSAAFELCRLGCTGANRFVTRNDSSGTESKEIAIWLTTPTGTRPTLSGSTWYFATGLGMSATLTYTNTNNGYTLTDRATWWSMTTLTNLKVVCELDPTNILANPYSFILVNSTQHPNVNQALAEKFVAYCLSDYGQARIGAYFKGGHYLFNPSWYVNSTTDPLGSNWADILYWNSTIYSLGMNTLA